MSTDYNAACFTCGEFWHIGTRFTSGWAWGNGHGRGDRPFRGYTPEAAKDADSGGYKMLPHLENYP